MNLSQKRADLEARLAVFHSEARDEVKTRKIIRYSNVIAETSNVIYTAVTSNIHKLDVGGILVMLWNLFRDRKFKQEVKREFITERFNELVRGEDYDFE